MVGQPCRIITSFKAERSYYAAFQPLFRGMKHRNLLLYGRTSIVRLLVQTIYGKRSWVLGIIWMKFMLHMNNTNMKLCLCICTKRVLTGALKNLGYTRFKDDPSSHPQNNQIKVSPIMDFLSPARVVLQTEARKQIRCYSLENDQVRSGCFFAALRRYQASHGLDCLVRPLGISNQPSEREFISSLRNGLVLC